VANINLGVAYGSQGDFSKAIEYHEHRLANVKEVGDFTRESWAYANIGTGHMHLNESDKAVAYFEAQNAWGNRRSAEHGCRPHHSCPRSSPGPSASMKSVLLLALTKLLDRVVTRRHLRWSACGDKVAPGCLRCWSSFGKPAHGASHFDAGHEDAALHLKEHLSWRLQRGRDIRAVGKRGVRTLPCSRAAAAV
jgi:tetratricopeptide (TPR) repeat protein